MDEAARESRAKYEASYDAMCDASNEESIARCDAKRREYEEKIANSRQRIAELDADPVARELRTQEHELKMRKERAGHLRDIAKHELDITQLEVDRDRAQRERERLQKQLPMIVLDGGKVVAKRYPASRSTMKGRSPVRGSVRKSTSQTQHGLHLNGDEADVRFLMRAGVSLEDAHKRVTLTKALSRADIDGAFDRIEKSIKQAGGLRG